MITYIKNELLGKTIIKIENDSASIKFYLSNGAAYEFIHEQDCCEYVYIEDIEGCLNDLIGYTLTQAEETLSDASGYKEAESATWTFYKFATIKGYVTIRWYGESSGYYSEGVSMLKFQDEFPIKEMRKMKLKEIESNETY